MRDDFAVFIITHGRPDNQITLKTLQRGNYTGKLYFIVDDEDDTLNRYIELYGSENVILFHKSEWFDIGDNLKDHKGVPVYARNECFGIAKRLGLNYFVQLDDDYPVILYRYEDHGKLAKKNIDNFDLIFDAFCDFLSLSQITCIAFAVNGDFIGGLNGKFRKKITFGARNSFFCKTDSPFEFLGRVNEDCTTPAWNNSIGNLFLTIHDIMVFLKDHVVSFDKKEQAKITDTITGSDELRSVVFARNACYDIANKLGLKYFAEFDDDLSNFCIRYVAENQLKTAAISDFDAVVNAMIEFMDVSDAWSVGIHSANGMIGGINGKFKQGLLRGVYQSFILRTDKRIEFKGLTNQDDNAANLLNQVGNLTFQIMMLNQASPKRASNEGGLHDLYKNVNQYLRTLNTLIVSPSNHKIWLRNGEFTLKRIPYMYPLIINQRWKR